MPFLKHTKTYTLLAGGFAFTTALNDPHKLYRVIGTVALAGSNTFNAGAGTPILGCTYQYEYLGQATYAGGNTVSFHGVALTAVQALTRCMITAIWDGSTWQVFVDAEMSQNNTIEYTKLVYGAGGFLYGIKEVVIVPLNIVTNPSPGAARNYDIYIPYPYKVVYCDTTVMSASIVTGDIVLSLLSNLGPNLLLGGGVTRTFPVNSAICTAWQDNALDAGNTGNTGGYTRIQVTGATTGVGILMMKMILQRL